MSGPRRLGFWLASLGMLWYVCCIGLWAVRPSDDAVPVGVDYTVTPPKAMSVTVKCNSLFSGAARNSAPLPALKPQPIGSPFLAFQRTPCSLPHRQARLVFALDTLAVLAALGLGVWLLRSQREQARGPMIAGAATV